MISSFTKVYPDKVNGDTVGTAIPSTRMKVFYEAINDYRVLRTLEKLFGREEVNKRLNSAINS